MTEPIRQPAGEYQMTVTVTVDHFGVVYIGGVGIGPSIIAATNALFRRPRPRRPRVTAKGGTS